VAASTPVTAFREEAEGDHQLSAMGRGRG
jgi:hypothetical protein